jgi:hypothetical protein
MDDIHNLTMLLPLHFGRGEGRGEGWPYVVYPMDPTVMEKFPKFLRASFPDKQYEN